MSPVIVSWRGVGVALDGDRDLIAGVVGQLPAFYGTDGEVHVEAVLARTDGLAAVQLPDDLSYSGPDNAETQRACASRIELALVHRLPDLVAVHAGVVATKEGAIVLPGRSMAGKSTLVRALVDAGATYLSDEFALIDSNGLVYPYPRAMTIRTATGSERVVPVHAASPDDSGRPVRLVALLRHDEAAGWDVRDLTPGQVAMGLIDNCVSVRRVPVAALTAVTAVSASARAMDGTRGEAASLIGHLGVARRR